MSDTIQQLAQMALLGTERQAAGLPKAEAGVQEIFEKLAKEPAEKQLLGAAGALFLYRRVGRVPSIDKSAMPGVAPEESLPSCSVRAAGFLKEMLGGRFVEVLPEWLEACAAHGKRVPPEDLPALLNVGNKKAELREAILKVIGQRGVWLAAQNVEWSYVAGAAEDQSLWETGSRAARLTFLQRLRKREPAKARELLQSTWAQEPPEDRVAFLGALEISLNAADEEFLESALDDKRKEVRQAAAGLLAIVPESRYCQRMIERVKPLVQWAAGEKGSVLKLKAGKKSKMEVTLPTACDKAMTRDGIETKKLSDKGEKGFWLQQMIEAVPISFWGSHWGIAPAEILEAASSNKEWRAVLVEGWATAAVRAKDAAWAEALLAEQTPKKMLPQTGALLQVLPAPKREAAVLAALKGDWEIELVFESMLSEVHEPWSLEFSKTILKQAKELAKSGNWSVRNYLLEVGQWLHPGIVKDVASDWPTEGKNWNLWTETVDQFIAMIQFRHDMLVALQDEPRQTEVKRS